MEVVRAASGGPQLLHLGAGVITLLLTVVAVCSLPSLMGYCRRWWVMKLIPGISPCYPVLGNALLLEREGEGKSSLRHSPALGFMEEPALVRCLPGQAGGGMLCHFGFRSPGQRATCAGELCERGWWRGKERNGLNAGLLSVRD